MNTIFQVKHSKDLSALSKKKRFVATALFRVTPVEKKIVSQWEFIGTFKNFITHVKEEIPFEEAKSLKWLHPVVEISIEYGSKDNLLTYSMEALLTNIYFINDKKIEELGTDLFIALTDKWLEFHENNKRKSA